MSLMMVSVVLMMLTRAIACGKRIAEVLEEKPRITDEQADPALKVEDGSIRFDHVFQVPRHGGGLESGGRELYRTQRGHGRHTGRHRQRQDHAGEHDPPGCTT